jgi:hypothetical protein
VAKRQRVRILAPVQDEAPAPVVVNATLVADVVNAPVVVQHVAVQNVVPETPMEVEDEDSILERLFFKKYGRALPEKEKESEVDQIKFVIDLTDDSEEMEVATPVVVVKTEPAESVSDVANVADVTDVVKQRRASRRLEIIELAKARKAITAFGKSLRKTDVIQEKEAPLAASSNIIATDDTDMAEDVSVNEANSDNPVGSVNSVNAESLTTAEAFEMAEAAIAESDAAIAANQKVIDKFYQV